MKKFNQVVGILLMLFLPLSLHGATNICTATNTTKIYFVNGVWNTYKQAEGTRKLLSRAYKQNLEIQYLGQRFEFMLAYNYHAGKIRDVIEVIGQKMNELSDPEVNKRTADQYFRLYMTARVFNDIVPFAARPLTTTIEEYLAGRITDTVNASVHIQRYESDLLEGYRLLLIAHSQGNLFADQAILALLDRFSGNIGMIGVASPSAVIYNNSLYYTAHDDRVIDALRVVHNVLPSNVDNDPGLFNDPRDFSNHQFEPSYFTSGLDSRGKIDLAVNNYMTNLIFPSAQLGNGAITATLMWGVERDVDLHAFEPNGIHVYYANLQGQSGFLDLDDVTSYGPEHYFVSCTSLETGTYRIGVNYYSGTLPETARIQIAAGTSVRSFTRELPTALGSSGNNSPVPVADIVVTGDQTNGFTFDIREVVPDQTPAVTFGEF